MPPELIPDNYSKKLEKRPENVSSSILSSTHYLTDTGTLYKINHCLIDDGVYEGCIEVYEMILCDGNEAYFIDYMLPDALQSEDIVGRLLGYGMHDESPTCIARFAYSKCNVHTDNKSLLGAQIRGAYVKDEHSGDGLASFVYGWLLDYFGCVISDNKQTQEGAGLWAYKFSTKYQPLHIYDQCSGTYSGKLTSNFSKPCGGNIWSTNSLKAGDISDEDYTVSFDDCHNKTVLFFSS